MCMVIAMGELCFLVVYCKHLYSVLRFLCKVDYDNDKFIHAPRFAYNEVMQLLELAGVVECE